MATKDEIVRGYARALLEVAEAEDDLGTVEDELFAFAKVVERDGRLSEALTDPALPAENKRTLVKELLTDRANPHTVSILGFLIEQGRAKELGRIVEGLAELAAERRRHVVAEVRSSSPSIHSYRAYLVPPSGVNTRLVIVPGSTIFYEGTRRGATLNDTVAASYVDVPFALKGGTTYFVNFDVRLR